MGGEACRGFESPSEKMLIIAPLYAYTTRYPSDWVVTLAE
jgi:hypothetical protein